MLKSKIKNKQKNSGITLIALAVTIIVLIILAGVSLNLILGENGIITRAKEVEEENIKQTAFEKLNLKITQAQMNSYIETEHLASLQYLADSLCNDEEIEYVITKNEELSSCNPIVVAGAKSIFTKLNDYPPEFEIDDSLKLVSIDGIKIADNNSNLEEIETLKNTIKQLQQTIGQLEQTIDELQSESNVKITVIEDKGLTGEHEYDIKNFTDNWANLTTENFAISGNFAFKQSTASGYTFTRDFNFNMSYNHETGMLTVNAEYINNPGTAVSNYKNIKICMYE